MKGVLLLVCSLAAAGCEFDRPPAVRVFPAVPFGHTNLTAAEVASFEPGRDYFPEKVAFQHSTQLRASYHGHYKVVRLVTEAVGEEFRFVFVQRGTPVPPLGPDDVLIPVPVARFSLATYRYGALAERLGVVDRIVGFGNHTHVTTPSIRRLFDTGHLQRNFDLEAIAQRGTEAHFNWYATGRLSKGDDAVARVGSLAIPAAEHLEPTPLARAEWIKFFGMFFNKEREADALFADIERGYAEARRQVPDAAVRPRVFVNLPAGGSWAIFGGRNQLARIIEDAGGEYVWHDNTSPESGVRAPYEAALDRGIDADVWLMSPESVFGTRIAGASIGNPRFAGFRAVQANRVFVNHRNYPDGPNPWWDNALIEPYEELLDLIAIFYPDTARRDLRFYRQLTGDSEGLQP